MPGIYLAIGECVWGSGATESEAVTECGKVGTRDYLEIYHSPTLALGQAWIDPYGCLCWNGGTSDKPRKIATIDDGKRVEFVPKYQQN